MRKDNTTTLKHYYIRSVQKYHLLQNKRKLKKERVKKKKSAQKGRKMRMMNQKMIHKIRQRDS